jgi:hypothetical protein
MIRAFFDESGQGDIFLMAGWVTDDQTWERFSKDWTAALQHDPPIRYFKHHEAKGDPPSGEFVGWSKKQIEDKITTLVDVICRHEMYGVTSGLKVSTHKAAFAKAVMPRKQLRSVLKGTHHYQSCVFSAHAMVIQMQTEGGHMDKIVDCVFDEMSGLLGECISIYKKLKPLYPKEKRAIAGSMTQANDKKVAALQAADLLAGQLTTNLRLGHPEKHYQRLAKAHKIYHSPAYFPRFDKLPELVAYLNAVWSTLQLTRQLAKLDSPPPRVKS